jgi:hypothetical protein
MATREQIDLLRLAPRAKAGAVLLNERFPDVKFTSGYRDLAAQARVMAVNQFRDPKWIGKTYYVGQELQSILDKNITDIKTLRQLEQTIYDYLAQQSESWLSRLSRHLSGYAFDVEPWVDRDGLPTAQGWELVDFMRTGIGAEKILLREGNQVIWHCQFTPTEEI